MSKKFQYKQLNEQLRKINNDSYKKNMQLNEQLRKINNDSYKKNMHKALSKFIKTKQKSSQTEEQKTVQKKASKLPYKERMKVLKEGIKDAIDSGDAEKLTSLIPEAKQLMYKLTEEPKISIKPSLYESYEYGALEYYAGKGDIEMTEGLLELGSNPNFGMTKNSSPLYEACLKDNFEIADLLLIYEANSNFKDQNGVTPLHLAVINDNLDMIKMLLEEKANPNVIAFPEQDRKKKQLTPTGKKKLIQEQKQPLHKIEQNKKELFNKYIGHDEKLYEKQTPLHMAMRNDNMKVVKLLINSEGFDPNIADSRGLTAASYALEKGDTELMEILVNKGLDANIFIACNYEIDGSPYLRYASALHHAVRNQDVETVKLLLEKGHGSNPGSWLNPFSWFGGNKSLDVNRVDELGSTPLSTAAKVGDLEIVKLLVEHHADIDKFNESKFDKPTLFKEQKHQHRKELELKEKFDAPIYEAAKNNDVKMLKYLVKQGAKLDIKQPGTSGTIVDKLISEKYDIVNVKTLKYLIEECKIVHNTYNLNTSSNKKLAAYGKKLHKEKVEFDIVRKLKMKAEKLLAKAKYEERKISRFDKKNLTEANKKIAEAEKELITAEKKFIELSAVKAKDNQKELEDDKKLAEEKMKLAVKESKSAKTKELKAKADKKLAEAKRDILEIEKEIAEVEKAILDLDKKMAESDKSIAEADKKIAEIEKIEIEKQVIVVEKHLIRAKKEMSNASKSKQKAEEKLAKSKAAFEKAAGDLAKLQKESDNAKKKLSALKKGDKKIDKKIATADKKIDSMKKSELELEKKIDDVNKKIKSADEGVIKANDKLSEVEHNSDKHPTDLYSEGDHGDQEELGGEGSENTTDIHTDKDGGDHH